MRKKNKVVDIQGVVICSRKEPASRHTGAKNRQRGGERAKGESRVLARARQAGQSSESDDVSLDSCRAVVVVAGVDKKRRMGVEL